MTRLQVAKDTQSSWNNLINTIIGLDARRVPALAVAFLIAELLFKFGSFALECVAFLALWRVLDLAVDQIAGNDD